MTNEELDQAIRDAGYATPCNDQQRGFLAAIVGVLPDDLPRECFPGFDDGNEARKQLADTGPEPVNWTDPC